MSIQKTYSFLNPANYQFDPDLIEVDNGARMNLIDDLGLTLVQNFDNDTGFTYDPAKAEFVGGQVQQIDKTPADEAFYVNFNTDKNANRGLGVLTGVLAGSPLPLIENGYLKFSNVSGQQADYDANNNASFPQVGCFRMRIRPQYSGNPSNTQIFIVVTKANNDTDNAVGFVHLTTGRLRLTAFDENGVDNSVEFTTTPWNPVSGTTYELELNYNFITGAQRLFIDGVQWGTTQNIIMTRSFAIALLRLGGGVAAPQTPNFWVDDLQIFSSVQHTTNYTPVAAPEYAYEASNVELPRYTYTGPGSVQELTNFLTTEAGLSRYTINDMYWNGSAWNPSNNSYAQANDKTTIITNLSSFPHNGSYTDIIILFEDSNTQSSVNILTVEYTGQKYPLTNPSLLILEQTTLEELLGFVATIIKTGIDEIKFILYKDTVPYYHNGVDWVVSNGTYSQANTYAVIDFYKDTFITQRTSMQIEIFFHTGSGGLTTPEIEDLTVTYDFAGFPDEIHKTVIYGFQKDIDCNPDLTPIKAFLNKSSVEYKQTIQVTGDEVQAIPNSNGYWELELTETDNMESDAFYFFRFKDRLYKKKVPVADFKSFNELENV